MKINLWYSKSMSQWRWTLVEEWRNGVTKTEQHSGQQPMLRDAMEDVAKTVEYMLECKDRGDQLSGRASRLHRGCHWFEPGISHINNRKTEDVYCFTMDRIKVRCRSCGKELEGHPSKTVSCGCPNMATIRGDKISAVDLSEVVMLNFNQPKDKKGVLTQQDIEWQEQRRQRKVRKLDFEVK